MLGVWQIHLPRTRLWKTGTQNLWSRSTTLWKGPRSLETGPVLQELRQTRPRFFCFRLQFETIANGNPSCYRSGKRTKNVTSDTGHSVTTSLLNMHPPLRTQRQNVEHTTTRSANMLQRSGQMTSSSSPHGQQCKRWDTTKLGEGYAFQKASWQPWQQDDECVR